ncbi:MAG: hypothetical protein FJ216_10735 [Ignavibacteria bacterium]|nr:hypothetical protein [Ignavibacteria bacterium]
MTGHEKIIWNKLILKTKNFPEYKNLNDEYKEILEHCFKLYKEDNDRLCFLIINLLPKEAQDIFLSLKRQWRWNCGA